MSRSTGGKNKSWTKEEKLRIVNRYLTEGIGRHKIAAEEGIASGMLWHWIRKYQEEGPDALENKRKKGNMFAALHTSKSLSEVERLRLTVLKQEIEIERLKKGYIVKGVGAEKEYVSTNNVNTK